MIRECIIDQGEFNNAHHTIPRCYGGESSPLVDLCYSCHTNLHTVGDRLIKVYGNKPVTKKALMSRALEELRTIKSNNLNKENSLKLVQLSIYVFRAYQATQSDDNRRVTLPITNLPVGYVKKLDVLKVRWGLKNRTATLMKLLDLT